MVKLTITGVLLLYKTEILSREHFVYILLVDFDLKLI